MLKSYLLIVLTIISLAMLGAQVEQETKGTTPPATEDSKPKAEAEKATSSTPAEADKGENAGNTDAENKVATESEAGTEKSMDSRSFKRNTIYDHAPKISKFRPQYIIMPKNAICSIEGESIAVSAEEAEKAMAAAYDYITNQAKPEDQLDKRSYVYSRDKIIYDLIANREKSIVQVYGRRQVTKSEGEKKGSKSAEEGSANKEQASADSSAPASSSSEGNKSENSENKDFVYLNIFHLSNAVRDMPISRKEYMSDDITHWRVSYDLNSGEVFNLLLN